MSEPKLISPMLDNFAMGDPISSHDGVCCCPAMKDDSDNKYIVKIISIPASQTQLDALLITGAYKDEQAANAYFGQIALEIQEETQTLSSLAKQSGFLPYEGLQTVSMDIGIGYDIYLLSSYKRSLDKIFRCNPLTHLGALNMGIDLCSALAECRKAGYLYVDLKPGNVFLSEDGRYKIGDIGFVSLDSVQYLAMPQRYRSSWTAPEMNDPLETLNTTVDIYALGLVLYQAYNNGTLPFEGDAPDEVLPSPMYADYELAEIILKACAPNPEDRWQDPAQMGQALVAYMQRNGANDTPIIPPKPTGSESDSDFEESNSDFSGNPDTASDTDSDETVPGEEDVESLSDDSLSDEASSILAQAEDLIAHEAPGPAVAPEPADISVPAPIADDEEEEESADAEIDPDNFIPDEENVAPVKASKCNKKTVKRIVISVVSLLLAAFLLVGVWSFYNDFYMIDVENVVVEGLDDTLTLRIDSEAAEGQMIVRLSDSFGNSQAAAVQNGIAKFVNLEENSQFNIKLDVEGLHRLRGKTDFSYYTQAKTNIVGFTAKAGSEDGSVILNFTVDGPDQDEWTVGYSAEGEEEQFLTFPGHMATISNLTIGKTYQLRLVPTNKIYLSGENKLEFAASKIVLAEDLKVTSLKEKAVTVGWTAPDGVSVKNWSVRCYNDAGYDNTVTTSELTATFNDIDINQPHTIEVTAEGMTLCARTYLTANMVNVTDIQESGENPNALSYQWEFEGQAPDGGWLLIYTVDGSDEQVVQCESPEALVSPKIPGAHYEFQLQTVTGVTVSGGTFSADIPAAQDYSGYDVTKGNMSFSMCRTPDYEGWSWYELYEEDYTNSFTPDEKASFTVELDCEYDVGYDDVTTLFVIRSADNKPVIADTDARPWVDMWLEGYCELDVPNIPVDPGTYTIEIYFDGGFVHSQEFTISAN